MTRTAEAIAPLSALFVVAVEKLRENEHKGHWGGDDPMALWNRLSQETAELHAELHKAKGGQPYDLRAIARECGDIVNLAMMVGDNVGAFDEKVCAHCGGQLVSPDCGMCGGSGMEPRS